jgi:hypothetical protein
MDGTDERLVYRNDEWERLVLPTGLDERGLSPPQAMVFHPTRQEAGKDVQLF